MVDVSTDAICSILDKLKYGDNSNISFITSDGIEINSKLLVKKREDAAAKKAYDDAITKAENDKAAAEKNGTTYEEQTSTEYVPQDFTLSLEPADILYYDFYASSVYKDFMGSDELAVTKYIKINGTTYLLMLQKCNPKLSGGAVCLLVPKTSVTKSADNIKNITITVVIVAFLLALFINLFITSGISKNMKIIISKLGHMSKGDLTIEMNTSLKNEFGLLSEEILAMEHNTRNLITKVFHIAKKVSEASYHVSDSSNHITDAFHSIKEAMDDINSGFENQAEDTQACNTKMEHLSKSIKLVSDNIEFISSYMDKVKEIVSTGIRDMLELKQSSSSTAHITQEVIQNIHIMDDKSKAISQIITVINDISSQTKLLSLNASIEAARAGQFGRGFSVVAEEIKKLADSSTTSVNEIQNIVNEINHHTLYTVQRAEEAEAIVNDQEVKVETSISHFRNINQSIEELSVNIFDAKQNMLLMEENRSDTLSAIENIAAVAEETAAASTVITNTAGEQFEALRLLSTASDELNKHMKDFESSLQQFKIDK